LGFVALQRLNDFFRDGEGASRWFGFRLLEDEPSFAIALNGIMISDPYEGLSHVEHTVIQIKIALAQP
jgi:hypothetical protein